MNLSNELTAREDENSESAVFFETVSGFSLKRVVNRTKTFLSWIIEHHFSAQ